MNGLNPQDTIEYLFTRVNGLTEENQILSGRLAAQQALTTALTTQRNAYEIALLEIRNHGAFDSEDWAAKVAKEALQPFHT